MKIHSKTRFGNFEKKKAPTVIHITSVLDPYIARGSPAPLGGSTAHQRVHTDVAIKGTGRDHSRVPRTPLDVKGPLVTCG